MSNSCPELISDLAPDLRGLSHTQELGNPPATVFIVSGDKALRQVLYQRSEALGARPRAYASVEAFFAAFDPTHPACLLLDIHVPSRGGLRLQQQLQDLGSPWPVLFVSEASTVPQAVQAMRAGAVDFLLQPLECPDLLEARLKHCLAQARAHQERQKKATAINARLACLTRREWEVMEGLIEGKQNKHLAFELNISLKTVEIHRFRVMKKLQVRNRAELINLMLFGEKNQGKTPGESQGISGVVATPASPA